MAKESIKGIDQVIRELRAVGKDIEKQIDAQTAIIAMQISSDAKKLAPKNFGKLAQSISYEKVKESNYKVTVNEFYAPYMEFGTGTKVNVPAEFRDMAATFKGGKGNKGTYKQGLESIRLWCRKKGIDEKFAYVIFASILGAGVNPKPFLYPSWIKGKKDYLDNLKKLLSKYNKKI
jgi:HK97 gp10 family phage protein